MKGKMLLRIALLIGVLYLIGCWGLLGASQKAASTAYETGYVQGITLAMMPHMGLVFMGDLFAALALFMYKKAFALTAGILFAASVAFALGLIWGIIVPMVLCFIAYAQMDKQAKQLAAQDDDEDEVEDDRPEE